MEMRPIGNRVTGNDNSLLVGKRRLMDLRKMLGVDCNPNNKDNSIRKVSNNHRPNSHRHQPHRNRKTTDNIRRIAMDNIDVCCKGQRPRPPGQWPTARRSKKFQKSFLFEFRLLFVDKEMTTA